MDSKPSKVRAVIIYPFPNFNGAAVLKFGNGWIISSHTLGSGMTKSLYSKVCGYGGHNHNWVGLDFYLSTPSADPVHIRNSDFVINAHVDVLVSNGTNIAAVGMYQILIKRDICIRFLATQTVV